ncbi:hypothetical protein [Ancylomarina sp. 16SWW S1-10-2]|uniref:hypothetical protein n=1 Tax=Ancylomarina sp. 16SWW S1-10-2 TaxID=2499681 RepID=UPI0012AD8B1C|nr:hypothetical protein [Ancylomarina sp. 16SWW S1-10-2]MRT92222.1 hypothetical protein [Ancylomarina sp. 16SWW S1-10-2]
MKFYISLLFLITTLQAHTQNNDRQIEVDHFGNIYTIEGIELTKYSSNKEVLSNFSDALLGEITSVDVSNPLRIQLFYKEFNQILYLNQSLSPITDPIDLYTYSDNEAQVCCDASSGGFWMYNNDDNQVFQVSKQGDIINKSGLLTSYFKGISPSKLIEYQERIYFLIPAQGLLILNKFGQFYQQIPIPGIIDFCINNQKVNYIKSNTWYKYEPLLTSDSIIYHIKNSGVIKSRILNDKIYMYSENQISIRSLKD